MSEKKIKLTKKHYELFKAECERWIQFFGLTEWSYYFSFENGKENMAHIYINNIGKCCTINLSNEWVEFPDKNQDIEEQIKVSAFHEIAHLLSGDLIELGRSRFVTEDQIIEAEETFVRRMENTVYRHF